MKAKEILAKNIKAYRKQFGWSQQELSQRTKLSVRYISYLENAEPNVTLDILERLAKGFGISISQLVHAGGEFEAKPPKKAKVGLEYAAQLLNRLKDNIE